MKCSRILVEISFLDRCRKLRNKFLFPNRNGFLKMAKFWFRANAKFSQNYSRTLSLFGILKILNQFDFMSSGRSSEGSGRRASIIDRLKQTYRTNTNDQSLGRRASFIDRYVGSDLLRGFDENLKFR